MIVSVVLITMNIAARHQPSRSGPNHTQIALLGTGNPPADPDRSGPATAVVVNGTPYLVDFGAGVVRRAKAAVVDRGIAALEPVTLRVVFVTHLHSDHTVGYADLILTPWVLGRRFPLEVYGPTGIKGMTDHLLEAYSADFETRTKDRGLYSVGAISYDDAQLIELAAQAKPGLLILYHASLSLRPAVDAERSTPAALLAEMSRYAGHVVVGRDLDVY
jgi:ribonuclease BN (tRNA processing enzyme)